MSEKEMEGGGAKALQKTHHALVTGTNMPPIPQTISMMAPPANGTPSFSIEPGLAIRDNAVIVPKRPVVMRRACGTMAGATLSIMYLWKQAHTSQHSSGVSERERVKGIAMCAEWRHWACSIIWAHIHELIDKERIQYHK